jgi:hypothetical protein
MRESSACISKLWNYLVVNVKFQIEYIVFIIYKIVNILQFDFVRSFFVINYPTKD